MAELPAVLQERVDRYYALLAKLLGAEPVSFADRGFRSDLPNAGGVYAVELKQGDPHAPLYVGQAGDLRERIYTNQFMGNRKSSTLKDRLIKSGECTDEDCAKVYLRKKCRVRCICIEDARERKLFEHFALAVLAPELNK